VPDVSVAVLWAGRNTPGVKREKIPTNSFGLDGRTNEENRGMSLFFQFIGISGPSCGSSNTQEASHVIIHQTRYAAYRAENVAQQNPEICPCDEKQFGDGARWNESKIRHRSPHLPDGEKP